MRAFFALHPPRETLSGVRAVLDRLAELPQSGRLRLVPPRNLHLTLKFLGEVPLAELETLCEAGRLAAEQSPLKLTLAGTRTLGSKRHGVFALGVTPSPALEQLAEALESALVERGFPASRRGFKPHLTLARARRMSPDLKRTVKDAMSQSEAELAWPVESFALVKSRLAPAGASYSIIEEFPLG